ncbi:formimidoylglutamase [Simiduia agarivorans]|uniref:Formimidoylglutamase n=1 Tax=Simiduia agarivorans (strain DSM 21679 / JCM 13881 / BCRC 17597 / SA1) TaxID=1117647 RepID=K4KG77_SIMAS|nr:formimidoylglutamase [Simiduia agarivorans]AFU97976.1 formimidoylglutamase [Simiduia agarivorans SA1 = DSM 21679]
MSTQFSDTDPHYRPADPALWNGRIDDEEALPALRWHQQTQCISLASLPPVTHQLVQLGFACDAGVMRNKGRPGAVAGPDALRGALCNLACDQTLLFDAGTIACEGDQLEPAQASLASAVARLRAAGAAPVVFGGGHEIAWGSFQGLMPELNQYPHIGIVNFDAHLDLRRPEPAGSSGTPFRQIAEWCQQHQHPFHYLVVGANQSANTDALWQFASAQGVQWLDDISAETAPATECYAVLDRFLAGVDALYITVCMDVFNAAFAPGVSAPAAMGLSPGRFFHLFKHLLKLAHRHQKPVLLLDIAELNPHYDRDHQTAKLAARIVWEYQTWRRQAAP